MQKIAGFGEACHETADYGRFIARLAQNTDIFAILAEFERSDASTMTSEFIETGQTFSDKGAPYCPVERRRRGPAALAVSISVLLAGAGFLTYSIMSTPSPIAAAPATSISVVEVSPAPEATVISVKEALAESRARARRPRFAKSSC